MGKKSEPRYRCPRCRGCIGASVTLILHPETPRELVRVWCVDCFWSIEWRRAPARPSVFFVTDD